MTTPSTTTTTTKSAAADCAYCKHKIPLGWKGHMAGERHVCCSRKCADLFAHQELGRMERWMRAIFLGSRGKAHDLAGVALCSNMEPL